MRRYFGLTLLPVIGFVTALPAVASAQTQPPNRLDVTGTIGWLATELTSSYDLRSYDRWESSLFGSGGAGWYWTDHLKTEVEFGASTEAQTYLTATEFRNGIPIHRAIERRFDKRLVGLSQQYQFFRNAWFHPHLAVGANLTWERRTDRSQPVFVYDPGTRTSTLVQPARNDPERTEFDVRPFVTAGYKAYMTRRAFFRNDLRIGFKDGIDEAILRFGFGVDF